jgi:alkanesulfonate monooxygenase SsuD/methylene tetrahydromethanopterin reductase-like flavin-dependent oxidoreductase (luciferase family)
LRLGTMVPHFGRFASHETIVDLAVKAEQVGFRGFWARDHLIWKPHESEAQDVTFIDPFVTLAAISAVTTKSVVGTSVAIPVRWPLKLAQEFASLALINRRGVLAGIGLGHNLEEFAAAGLDASQREPIFRDTVKIMRQAWDAGVVDFKGEVFTLDNVELAPKPAIPIPIIYGGKTQAAVRRAVQHTDGWNGGGLPIETLKKRMSYLEELIGDRRKQFRVINQPQVVISRNRREAEALVPIEAMTRASEGSRFYVRPPSGNFETVADLRGLVVCGTPDDVVDGIMELKEHGADELILDFRLQFDRYEEILELIGSEVIPRLDDIED